MAIAAVNRVQNANSGFATSIASSATSATAGNLLVALLQFAANTFSTFADTAGNTWTQAGTEVVNGTNRCRIYYAWNCLGHASNVYTTTYSGTTSYRVQVVHQFSGVETASDPLDDQDSATGTSASPATPSLTVSAASDVIVALILAASNSNVAGTGYTGVAFAATGDATNYFMDEYHIVTASEAATSSCTSSAWYIKAAAFMVASGAASGHPTMRRWGGTPYMGGQGIGQKGAGRGWG